MIFRNTKSPVQIELDAIAKKEEKLRKQAYSAHQSKWQNALEEKIPEKVHSGLQSGFAKAFGIIFEKGDFVLNKTLNAESIAEEFDVLDYAVERSGGKKDIRNMKRAAAQSNAVNTLLTTAEGIGFGALGIGLPDIVLWVGFLLRGVYETALKYGFSYDTPEEQYFQLKLIETSLQVSDKWEDGNDWVDHAMAGALVSPTQEEMRQQINRTSDTFAEQLLVAKFIQGLPIVGMAGGAANPFYYQKIMKYVELKYRKRYFTVKTVKNNA